jgi:CheY-like chemotaxis protein
VCLAILKQHGGDIYVESTEGSGSTFHVTLPLATAREQRPDALTPPIATPSRAPVVGTVLVVDDEDAVAGFVSAALRSRLGCGVQVVSNGSQAIDALATAAFSAILSDVRMPGVNGVELHDWVQQYRPDMLSRMVFATGDASGSELNTALEARGCQILRKPFSLDTLLSCVRDIAAQPA